MTTKRQHEANRRNAKKSTGPKTREGKSSSSNNATRHGLTQLPGMDLIERWFRVILNDAKAIPCPLEANERLKAAFRLAETEARLERVRNAEGSFLLDPESDDIIAGEMEEEFYGLQEAGEEFGWDAKGLKLLSRIRRFIDRDKAKASREQKKKARILARYRSEAEAQISKALKHWIEVGFLEKNKQIPKQSQIHK